MPRKVCACGCKEVFTAYRSRQRYLNKEHYGRSAECKAICAKGGRNGRGAAKRRVRRVG